VRSASDAESIALPTSSSPRDALFPLLRVLGHQLAEARGCDSVDASALDDPSNQINGLAGKHVELAEKRAWTEAHQRLLGPVAGCRLDDLDRRALGHDQVVGWIAGAVENLTGLDCVRCSIRTQAPELRIAQLGKCSWVLDLAFGLGVGAGAHRAKASIKVAAS
jgi:hypothetical protein